MNRMIKIFGAELEVESSTTFEFNPKVKDSKCVGVLISSSLESSLVFDNGNELLLHRLPVITNSTLAPDQKIIRFDKELKGCIQGRVYNRSKDKIRGSIYLLIAS